MAEQLYRQYQIRTVVDSQHVAKTCWLSQPSDREHMVGDPIKIPGDPRPWVINRISPDLLSAEQVQLRTQIQHKLSNQMKMPRTRKAIRPPPAPGAA